MEYGFKLIFYRNNENNIIYNDDTVVANLNNTEEAVYRLLIKNPRYTRDELADKTSKTVRTIQRTLDSLRNKNCIERIGSDKNGYWKIVK